MGLWRPLRITDRLEEAPFQEKWRHLMMERAG